MFKYLYSNRWVYLFFSIVSTFVSLKVTPDRPFLTMFVWHFMCCFFGYSITEIYLACKRYNKYAQKIRKEFEKEFNSEQDIEDDSINKK
jgi:hypothetical protein